MIAQVFVRLATTKTARRKVVWISPSMTLTLLCSFWYNTTDILTKKARPKSLLQWRKVRLPGPISKPKPKTKKVMPVETSHILEWSLIWPTTQTRLNFFFTSS